MSSLVRRIQKRLLAKITDRREYRKARQELKKSPAWNKPLLKSGRKPRAMRRSKRSMKWLQDRAAARRTA